MEELTKARKLYTPCPHCGLPLYPEELLCPHCKTPVESRLPQLDWARAQVLAEYEQQWRRSRDMETFLITIVMVLPIVLFILLDVFFVQEKIIRASTAFRNYSPPLASYAFLCYTIISSIHLILCGKPVTASAFSQVGIGMREIFHHGTGVGLGVLHHIFRNLDHRFYPLYYLFSLLINLTLGYFLLIPSMKTYVYEGRLLVLPTFLHHSVDLSQLPAMDRFYRAFCFCYYALCFLFFLIHLYRYLTPEFVCTGDIDLRRRIAGIPTEKRYEL